MIHVNFGWLNDYSGSKFAPFTLTNKALLNEEIYPDCIISKIPDYESRNTNNHIWIKIK